MDNILNFLKENGRYLAAGAAILGAVLVVVKRRKPRSRVCGVDYPKDKVILHVFPRSTSIPNLGHFVMKLETYLRINKIPFQVCYLLEDGGAACSRIREISDSFLKSGALSCVVLPALSDSVKNNFRLTVKIDFNFRGGPKSKIPWIDYNGVTMGDSHLIMQYFNEKFNINMNEHLSKEEKAVAWAIQKWLEEYTYWLNVHTRWVIFFDEFWENFLNLGILAKMAIRRNMISTTYTVGVGRHSDQQVHDLMVYDLKQFAAILGNKQYVMGDKISEVDCAAFGVLSQIRWCTPPSCPGHQLLTGGELQNVMDYLDRIKNKYWRDWEQLLDEAKRP